MKTIEEAAEEYAKGKSSSDIFIQAHKTDFKAGAEFAQRWIPTEEELPEKGVYVICKVHRYLPFIGSYTGKELLFRAEDTFSLLNITHWRPIEPK